MVKFGIFADLHVDIMHDGEKRLRAFLSAARAADVDFIIQLGDFCYPDEDRKCICRPENQPINIKNSLLYPTYADKDTIRSLYKNFGKPAYHVIGNHDCDMCTKKQILDYHGVEYEPYYSFDTGDFHFIVLDTNYFMEDGQYFSYENGNYFDKADGKERTLPYLPPFELEWLRDDLEKTDKPSLIFTHQSLRANATRAILNAEEFRKAIKGAKSKVVACFNGHTHLDGAIKEDGVWYMHLNSISNHWLGDLYTCPMRYGCEIDEKYPNIKFVAPYREPLFAIVELDKNGATIKGVESEIVGKTPEEMGYYEDNRGRALVLMGEPTVRAGIKDRYLSFSD